MKRILFTLLKNYTRNEKDRLEIYNLLYEQICNEYCEQNGYHNLYNAFIEFIISNKMLQNYLDNVYDENLVEANLKDAYREAVNIIKKEKISKPRREKLKNIKKLFCK